MLEGVTGVNPTLIARMREALAKGPILLRTSELEAMIGARVSGTAQAVADVLVKMAFTARASGMKVEELLSDVTETISVGAKPPPSPTCRRRGRPSALKTPLVRASPASRGRQLKSVALQMQFPLEV